MPTEQPDCYPAPTPSGSTAYDRDYFENGIAQGISLYENYRWLPELTMRMAHFLVMRLGIDRQQQILDFGCAKGFLVKALRLFDIQAWGCDVSNYAIDRVDADIKPFCRPMTNPVELPFPNDRLFDWIIAKDVLEHIEEPALAKLLRAFHSRSAHLFVVVPLGENGQFVVPEYNRDATHVIARNSRWWKRFFYANGWFVQDFRHSMTALKENWARRYPRGNGLFTLTAIEAGS